MFSAKKSPNTTEPEVLAERVRNLVSAPRVLYSDLDGTLLGPGGCLFLDAEKRLTLTPAKAIMTCHFSGIDVVLVSGRRRAQLQSDARVFGFNNWIAEMGCQIVYNKGELVVDNIGDFQSGELTVYEAVESAGGPKLLLDAFPGRLEYHTPWSGEREFTHLLRGYLDVEGANDLLARSGYEELKLMDNGRVHRISAGLSVDLPEIHAYHLLPKASGKASAVLKDREIRGIPQEATVAIGDSEADLELADEVGLLFLVANALTENHDIAGKAAARENVVVTNHAMGLGWAEAVGYLTGANLL